MQKMVQSLAIMIELMGVADNGTVQKLYTGQPRYLKVQGNGENTSSYPKFDISKM